MITEQNDFGEGSAKGNTATCAKYVLDTQHIAHEQQCKFRTLLFAMFTCLVCVS